MYDFHIGGILGTLLGIVLAGACIYGGIYSLRSYFGAKNIVSDCPGSKVPKWHMWAGYSIITVGLALTGFIAYELVKFFANPIG